MLRPTSSYSQIRKRVGTANGAKQHIKSVYKNYTQKTGKSWASASIPTLKKLISDHDYRGAESLLKFKDNCAGEATVASAEMERVLWVGYCSFHLGNFEKSYEVYKKLVEQCKGYPEASQEEIMLCLSCSCFQLKRYAEAEDVAKGISQDSDLKMRLLYLAKHQLNRALTYNINTTSSLEGQLSKAYIHYSCGQYQEAIDAYKRILCEDQTRMAIHVYIAMCYYKLDYYDVSLDTLSIYLQAFPDSVWACNIKACNHYRLHSGEMALNVLNDVLSPMYQLTPFHENLICHNNAVFTDGDNIAQVMKALLDIVPEARLNLVIYNLRNECFPEALQLLEEGGASEVKGKEQVHEASMKNTQELMLQATVYGCLGQLQNRSVSTITYTRRAEQIFQKIGMSPNECDTIPGRLCMASAFFLMKKFEDVNVYLNSVKNYMTNDDTFNWNYGISLAITGQYEEAEEHLLLVEEREFLLDFCFISWICRCYIRNGKPEKAWELYRQTSVESSTSEEELQLLQHLIANDCYQTEHFLYSARAFAAMASEPQRDGMMTNRVWRGLLGACIGVFRTCIALLQRHDQTKWDKVFSRCESDIQEVVRLLRASSFAKEVNQIIATIMKWSSANGFRVLDG